MHKIYKYPLQLRTNQTIELPVGYKILTAQLQGPGIQLWVWIDPEAKDFRSAEIAIIGTVNEIPHVKGCSYRFISTVQWDGLVWHIFIVSREG